jgi:hypothetical protein
MTTLNMRQSGIIDYLAAENDWVAANRVAESFAISVSTLRRDIEVINTSLGDQNSHIKSKPGLGLRYDGGSPFNRVYVSVTGIEGEIFYDKAFSRHCDGFINAVASADFHQCVGRKVLRESLFHCRRPEESRALGGWFYFDDGERPLRNASLR